MATTNKINGTVKKSKRTQNNKKDPVAIIGMGCRFPGGANNPEELWQMLVNKTDAITKIPADRWDADAMYHPDYTTSGKISVQNGGFIDEIDKWDAAFFNVSPLEATRIDPQHRLLLEVSYNAIEDAGLRLEDLNGSGTGVFVGISSHDYGDIQNAISERTLIGGHTNSGGAQSIAANRISYTFNLKGPSFIVDTACSSSLTAIHLACRSIWNGESSMALAGGVSIIVKPEVEMGFSKGGFLSPDGHCKAFDASANGYIRSEGAGMVLLKPLSKAIEDGDQIYAVVRGSAINQDGRTGGITVPNPDAQRDVILAALDNAGLGAADVNYVEAHGTGTAVGDPIEGNTIGNVYGVAKPDGECCHVGSIKTNIGHLEPASGVAGFIKVALSLYKGYILPNIHFKTPNPKIPFDQLKIKVPVELTPWGKKPAERFGGINSFGFGGANAHAILQGYEPDSDALTAAVNTSKAQSEHKLFCISARNEEALKTLAQRYIDYLSAEGSCIPFEQICYSAALRRTHHSLRLSVVASDKNDLKTKLSAFLEGTPQPGMIQGRGKHKPDVKRAFVFSGQGPQWWAMGRQLYENEPLFRSAIEEIEQLFKEYSGWSLIDELTKDEQNSQIYKTRITQPAIFAVQVGLARLWRSIGIEPDGIVGHSIGEVAAAHISGVLSLQDAVKLIYHRSRVQSQAEGKGKMLAVGMGLRDAELLIKPYKKDVSVAAINSPKMVTLSGATDVLETIQKLLEDKDTFCKFLKVDVPFHSHYMEPMKEDLISSLETLAPKKASIPLYSTVTGGGVKGSELKARYWYRNVREPVYFTSAIEAMINDGYELFVEISPHPILSSGISEIFTQKKFAGTVVSSLRRNENEWFTILNSLGMIYLSGASWDMAALFGSGQKYVKLPEYPYQKERFWLESDESYNARMGLKTHPHLLRETFVAREKNTRVWEISLDHRTDPYIKDHRVQGPIVFPGAGHVELGISAALNSFGDSFCFLENINFKRALFLPDEGEPPIIHLEIMNDSGNYYLYTKDRRKDSQWEMCSEGMINHIQDSFETRPINITEKRATIKKPIDIASLHADLDKSGLNLGKTFKAISELYCSEREAVAVLDVPKEIQHDFHYYNLHPSVLDSCFQTLFGAFFGSDEHTGKMGVYIPVHIDRVKFHKRPGSFRLYTYAKLLLQDDQNAMGDLWIFDEQGELVAEFQGFLTQYLKGSRGEVAGESNRWFYEYNWGVKYRKDQENLCNFSRYFPAHAELKDSVDKAIHEVHNWPDQKQYYEQFEPEFDILTISYITEALQQLNVPLETGTVLNVNQIIEDKNIDKRHHRLFEHMFKILFRNGYLAPVDNNWSVVKSPVFKSCTEQLSEVYQNFPDFKQEIELLGRCGPRLREVLLGETNPVELIFPEDKWDTIVDYYVNGFSFRKYNHIVSAVISAILKKVPDGKTLRVLEIGAGTGGVTQAILPLLPQERTEYYYTDLSHMFMLKAKERFQKHSFVKYRMLNIEEDPVGKGFEKHSFDLIVASDVIHATKSVKKTLEHASSLLASNGRLLMVEVTNAPIYLDLIFGMTEGWWLYEDSELRQDHATMPPEKWKQALEQAGFGETAVYSDIPDNSASSQSVILSSGPELEQLDKKEARDSFNGERWVVFAPAHGTGQKVINAMAAKGADVISVHSGESFSYENSVISVDRRCEDQMIKAIDLIIQKEPAGIAYLWPIDCAENSALSEELIVDGEKQYLMPLLYLTTKLNSGNLAVKPKMYMATSGAQCVRDSDPAVRVSASGFRGVGRTVINEFPQFQSTLVDFSSSINDNEITAFIDEMLAGEREDEIAYRDDVRYVNRLLRVSEEAARQASVKKVEADGYRFSSSIKDYGVLDSIFLHASERKELEPDQIEVQVKAAALNFRDIMVAMGLISGEAIEGGLYGRHLGLEACGIVSRIGANVRNFAVGDEVAGCAVNSLSGYVVGSRNHFVKKIDGLSHAQMAALPLVYLTAYYSFTRLAHVTRGEKVLIHAAAGGVGIAAIQIAKAMGAEVYATAGSNDKKEYLRALGVTHIYNSRSLHFADEIMKDTGGNGVDVVLNALSGPSIYKSLRCLAPFGRFVEMGKTDIYRNSQIGLKNFGNNISYHVVDVDRMLKYKPVLAGELLSETMQFFADNSLTPHPVKEFPVRETGKAFMYMAAARHIGKVVVTMDGTIDVDTPPQISFNKNETFLLTGGCSGFGLRIARWLAEKGAGTLVLISRSGPKTEEEKNIIAKMKADGVNVMVEMADVTNRNEVFNVFKTIEEKCPPLKGIFHCAMVLDDASIPEMTHERFIKAYRPKAIGCWNLHEASKNCNLDYFVGFSSISSVYGNPGQVNYAAGNCFLDEMARYRHSQGLPATTINWGVLGETGFVARTSHIKMLLAKQGWYTFSMREALFILEKMLLQKPVQRLAINNDWKKIGEMYPNSKLTSRFSHLIIESDDQPGSSDGKGDAAVKSGILSAPLEERTGVLKPQLKEVISRVLGTSPDKINEQESITALGLDSLMANQIRAWISNNLFIEYSMMRIMKGPTLLELCDHLINELNSTASDTADSSTNGTNEVSELDRLGIRTRKVEKPELRLFCFPYFAGGASVFSTWHTFLPENIEVCAIQFPGREERFDEAPYDDIEKLTLKIAEVIDPLLDVPVAFYTHSLGAMAGFELAKHLEKEKGIKLVQFIVGGWPSPDKGNSFKLLENVSPKEVYDIQNTPRIIQHLRDIGVPEEVVSNDQLINEMLPSLRADIVMGKKYRFISSSRLDCPLRAIAGSMDPLFNSEQLEGWKNFTNKDFSFSMINGGHLFARDNKDELLKLITEILQEATVKS
jgi:acyl transferase domain-containing protein/NADPH:quinone reductase-like Zn-dependent oxidoreductase/surfactin synthase thioesterase subunit/ubiquinone/menaquinone biosynthesis C-methylase UbiE/acyl carrier protein